MRILAVLTFAVAVVGVYLSVFVGFPHLVKRHWRKRFLARIKSSGAVCLTFDDGPQPGSTDRILDVLGKFGIKATFFMVGENVVKYPSLARRVLDSGHEVGEHSYWHRHPWKCDPFSSIQDLLKGKEALKRLLNLTKEPILRPPYGKLNLLSLFYCLRFKKRVAFWGIDPKDYSQSSALSIAKAVTGQLEAGSVVLLHDGRISNRRNSLELTSQALVGIIDTIVARDLKTLTISEALDWKEV